MVYSIPNTFQKSIFQVLNSREKEKLILFMLVR